MEPDEGLEKLQLAFHICGKYQENYEDRRAHLADYFKDQPVMEWDFEPSLVFARVDRLTGQLRLIEVRDLALSLSIFTHVLPLSGIFSNGEPVPEAGEDRIQWNEGTDAEQPGR